jgi:acetyl esterase/lipase
MRLFYRAAICLTVAIGLMIAAGSFDHTRAVTAATPAATDAATSAPTQTAAAPIEVAFEGLDNHIVQGLYYPAPRLPAPALLLLHYKESWSYLAKAWRARGFNVFAIDLRIWGPEGVSVEVARKDIQDILLVIQQLNETPGVTPHRVALLGGSTIGGYALVACAESADCKTAILFSATDYKGDLQDPIETLGNRPLLMVVSENEGSITATELDYAKRAKGEHRLIVYKGGTHATGLIDEHPELVDIVGDWLVKYLSGDEAATATAESG